MNEEDAVCANLSAEMQEKSSGMARTLDFPREGRHQDLLVILKLYLNAGNLLKL